MPPPDRTSYEGHETESQTLNIKAITPMPLSGSASAPKTFDGNEEEIADFLEHFIHCANAAQLPATDRVSFFMRYLSPRQKNVFRVLDGYDEKDWEEFEAAIRTEWRKAFEDKKVTKHKLLTFIGNTVLTPIETEKQLREYSREFQGFAKLLVRNKTLSEDDSAAYFWCGLHEQTRAMLLPKLESRFPNHSHNRPHPIVNILQVGETVFAADSWYKNLPTDAPNPLRQSTTLRQNDVTTRVVLGRGLHPPR